MPYGIKDRSIVNPLVLVPSPRDIADFKQAIDTIYEDKIWARYMREKDAYKQLQEFFLNKNTHTQYTHAVIIPDDLVVSRQSFHKLRGRLMMPGNIEKYPVLAGICNLEYHDTQRLSFCLKVSGFEFATNEDLETGRIRGGIGASHRSTLVKVGHEGFCCVFIRRDILEKIPLEGMNDEKDAHFDWAFSLNCYKHKIPIYVDTSARMLHLRNRLGEGVYENMRVGKPGYDGHMQYSRFNRHWRTNQFPKHMLHTYRYMYERSMYGLEYVSK